MAKLGFIAKEKADGSFKARLIVDMPRSKANSKGVVPERGVLPRPSDPVDDAPALFNTLGATAGPEAREVQFFVADFKDAYPHLPVASEGLKHALIAKPLPPGHSEHNRRLPVLAVLPRLMFGACAAPLVWCRFAAALGRMGQATLLNGAAATQIYTTFSPTYSHIMNTVFNGLPAQPTFTGIYATGA